MYTKEELEAMDIPQLVGIADQLGIKVKPEDEMTDVVYAILDKAAENSAADDSPKRKRTRIAKKDTSKVYTVNGDEGENLDSKSNRKKKKVESPSLFSDLPAAAPQPEEEEAPAAPAPKRRGRKSKAELAAEAAAAEAAEQAAMEAERVPEAEVPEAEVPEADFVVPEAGNFADNNADEDATNAIEQLREQLSNRKEQQAYPADTDEVDEDGVWLGDPGDGTDFITMIDIPIEDQEALPTLDMFDRPVPSRHRPQRKSSPVPRKHLSTISVTLSQAMVSSSVSPMVMVSSVVPTTTTSPRPTISMYRLSKSRNTV